jgi:hypothetical protein
MRLVIGTLLAVAVSSCGVLAPPRSVGEVLSGYSYVPLDPLPITVQSGANCAAGAARLPLLSVLPDNAVRIAVRNLSGDATLGFGPAKIGYQGSSYQVILDYVNYGIANIRFHYSGGDVFTGATPQSLIRVSDAVKTESISAGPGDGLIVVPVYVGVGLRLTADVTVNKGTVNLASLGALTAAAEAQRVTGTLVVQGLGMTGDKVRAALPLPSDLNATTIQNAIVSLGTIKALSPDSTGGLIVTPQVLGIYNPMPQSNQQTINLIVSQLIQDPPAWSWDCAVAAK